MFDFMKNKAIQFVLDDLDNCMNYIKYSTHNKDEEITQILNTLRHYIDKIIDGTHTEQEVQKYFMNMKTDIAFKKNLKDFKDAEYSKAYILNAFFTCVASNRLEISKINGNKILTYCVDNIGKELKPIATELKTSYMQIFK